MFEKFTTANAGDFRQRYEGTFGFYRDGESNKRILTKLTYIRNETCVFVDSRGVEYRLNPDSDKDIGFEFIPPRSYYYNIAGSAALVKRLAARQFQRGLSAKNMSVYTLTPKGLMQQRVDFPILHKIYLEPVDTKTAFGDWSKRDSVAISKQLACTDGTLYLFENKIGTYVKKDTHFTFKLEEPNLWRTEVTDALRALGCSAEVV